MFLKKKKFWIQSTAPYYKAGAFQGIGDVSSGAIGFYSAARAYSAAFAAGGTAIMDLQDQAGANPITINILTTGFADIASINAWVTAHTVTTIKVAKLYDQTGNGNHVTQATLANMPTLTLSALNGLPGVTSVAGGSIALLSGNITQGQPISFATVGKLTTTSSAAFIGSNSGTLQGLIGSASPNLWAVSGSTAVTVAATVNTFHAGQALLSGSSSFITVDGTSSSVSTAGAGTYSLNPISLCRANGSSLPGTIMESILWGADRSANFTAINTNQHGSNGYNF